MAGSEHRPGGAAAHGDLEARASTPRPGCTSGPTTRARPGTEVGALVQTGHCPNVFFSTNMKDCFGYMTEIGPTPIPRFSVPWWFRTDFTANPGHGDNTDLIVNGVVGEADVWVNGHEVATRDTVQGAYTRYTFDVTGVAAPRRQLARARGLSQQPEHDVHARQRRLDADPARQQHRLPVPDPAAHLGPARARQTRTSSRTTPPDLSSAALTLKADVTNHAEHTRRRATVSAT